jgi:hypothetical protein
VSITSLLVAEQQIVPVESIRVRTWRLMAQDNAAVAMHGGWYRMGISQCFESLHDVRFSFAACEHKLAAATKNVTQEH